MIKTSSPSLGSRSIGFPSSSISFCRRLKVAWGVLYLRGRVTCHQFELSSPSCTVPLHLCLCLRSPSRPSSHAFTKYQPVYSFQLITTTYIQDYTYASRLTFSSFLPCLSSFSVSVCVVSYPVLLPVPVPDLAMPQSRKP